MELQEIMQLIDQVSGKENLSEIVLEDGSFRLAIRTGRGAGREEAAARETEAARERETRDASARQETEEQKTAEREETAGQGIGSHVVVSPLVGTFYTAPSEGAPDYVKVGDRVCKGQVLAIVEAMKLMNEIECEYDGVVEAVLLSNGQLAEYGQPLFRIGDR